MLFDAMNKFSDAQAVTASAASTEYMDLGVARQIGDGENLYVMIVCDVAMTDTGSNSTLAVTLETDDNSSFSSATTVQTIGTFAATSAIGTKLIARLQPSTAYERYIRLYYTTANGDLSAGSFTAFLVKDVGNYKAYADNITIS